MGLPPTPAGGARGHMVGHVLFAPVCSLSTFWHLAVFWVRLSGLKRMAEECLIPRVDDGPENGKIFLQNNRCFFVIVRLSQYRKENSFFSFTALKTGSDWMQADTAIYDMFYVHIWQNTASISYISVSTVSFLGGPRNPSKVFCSLRIWHQKTL